jgi:hypothetical protein
MALVYLRRIGDRPVIGKCRWNLQTANAQIDRLLQRIVIEGNFVLAWLLLKESPTDGISGSL